MVGKCLLVSLLLAVTALFRGGLALDYLKDDEFHQWVSKYHKDGENLAEIYPTWRRNADFVKQHNSQDHSFTVAVNKFAHLVSSHNLLMFGIYMIHSTLNIV